MGVTEVLFKPVSKLCCVWECIWSTEDWNIWFDCLVI